MCLICLGPPASASNHSSQRLLPPLDPKTMSYIPTDKGKPYLTLEMCHLLKFFYRHRVFVCTQTFLDGGSMFLKNIGNHPQDFAVHQCVNLRSLFSGT